MRAVEAELDFSLAPKTAAPLELAEGVAWAADLPPGPFVRHDDGWLALDTRAMTVCRHEHGRWQRWPLKLHGAEPHADLALGVSRTGTLVLAFMDERHGHFRWLRHLRRASRNTRSPIFVSRSEDGGRSWSEPVMIQDGYSGAVRSMVTLPDGRLVLAVQYLLPDQARYVSLTYFSDDDGRSWRASNWLDAGGRGHHDGAIEGYLLPLDDRRLWYLVRSNLDRFWHAYSSDGGQTWLETRPGFAASSSPGALLRLSDGRIALAYNPVGEHPPRRAGDFSERAASWYREALHLALLDEKGERILDERPVARCEGAWLSYPHMAEPAPGRLWLTTLQSGLRLEINLEDLFS
ncbi:sialidase family protein [Sulfurivirga sp.]|uniref:sialidase family protein n=1 Tax=Sulfurivirga sp. TaxID=2614236 RepID=UPI0025D680C8|nr:sialidase family protein [Sulfurivirga sp.]